MIDLDPSLSQWRDARPWERPIYGWGEASAYAASTAVAQRWNLINQWEPGDEEWIMLSDGNDYRSMCSLFFPLFLAVPTVAASISSLVADPVVVVPITGFEVEDLRCSPDLLRATVLRYGWNHDFDPEAFCASDLFVESV
ncbi:hypothetical protein [Allokutzneria sp. NRRL B-24872]|uniref:hypothetical protein n=1 Tax=Allokutzneria sp. NRRL B-24872 TaxID=1137961 RepID=UPI000A35F2BB|nr:hypothetical protein [Allokutzneria sp. NRRL B-24872]